MVRKSQLAGPAVKGKKKLNGKEYARELRKLQTELVEMQEWVKATGARIVVVFARFKSLASATTWYKGQ